MKLGWIIYIAVLISSIIVSLVVASVLGGLLDYGVFRFYAAVLSTFSWSEPFDWFLLVTLFAPLAISLVGLTLWIKAASAETQAW
jgi:hypothetical protein